MSEVVRDESGVYRDVPSDDSNDKALHLLVKKRRPAKRKDAPPEPPPEVRVRRTASSSVEALLSSARTEAGRAGLVERLESYERQQLIERKSEAARKRERLEMSMGRSTDFYTAPHLEALRRARAIERRNESLEETTRRLVLGTREVQALRRERSAHLATTLSKMSEQETVGRAKIWLELCGAAVFAGQLGRSLAHGRRATQNLRRMHAKLVLVRCIRAFSQKKRLDRAVDCVHHLATILEVHRGFQTACKRLISHVTNAQRYSRARKAIHLAHEDLVLRQWGSIKWKRSAPDELKPELVREWLKDQRAQKVKDQLQYEQSEVWPVIFEGVYATGEFMSRAALRPILEAARKQGSLLLMAAKHGIDLSDIPPPTFKRLLTRDELRTLNQKALKIQAAEQKAEKAAAKLAAASSG